MAASVAVLPFKGFNDQAVCLIEFALLHEQRR
jgi:hypothetical protein